MEKYWDLLLHNTLVLSPLWFSAQLYIKINWETTNYSCLNSCQKLNPLLIGLESHLFVSFVHFVLNCSYDSIVWPNSIIADLDGTIHPLMCMYMAYVLCFKWRFWFTRYEVWPETVLLRSTQEILIIWFRDFISNYGGLDYLKLIKFH